MLPQGDSGASDMGGASKSDSCKREDELVAESLSAPSEDMLPEVIERACAWFMGDHVPRITSL